MNKKTVTVRRLERVILRLSPLCGELEASPEARFLAHVASFTTLDELTPKKEKGRVVIVGMVEAVDALPIIVWVCVQALGLSADGYRQLCYQLFRPDVSLPVPAPSQSKRGRSRWRA